METRELLRDLAYPMVLLVMGVLVTVLGIDLPQPPAWLVAWTSWLVGAVAVVVVPPTLFGLFRLGPRQSSTIHKQIGGPTPP